MDNDVLESTGFIHYWGLTPAINCLEKVPKGPVFIIFSEMFPKISPKLTFFFMEQVIYATYLSLVLIFSEKRKPQRPLM